MAGALTRGNDSLIEQTVNPDGIRNDPLWPEHGPEPKPVNSGPVRKGPVTRAFSGAGDQIRTGDPHLGKAIQEARSVCDLGRPSTFSQVTCPTGNLQLGRS